MVEVLSHSIVSRRFKRLDRINLIENTSMNTTRKMQTWYKVCLKSYVEGIYLSALNYGILYYADNPEVVVNLLLTHNICKYELNKRTKPKFGYIYVFEELEAAQEFKNYAICAQQHPVILRGTGVRISAAACSIYNRPKDAWKWSKTSKTWMFEGKPITADSFRRYLVGHWVRSFKPFEILPC